MSVVSGQRVYDDGTNEIQLGPDEVLLFGGIAVGEGASCQIDGRTLSDGLSHSRMPGDGVRDSPYVEWDLSWDKDYCLDHFEVEIREYE